MTELKFLKNGIRSKNGYVSCRYGITSNPKQPEGTIVIRAKGYDMLPVELYAIDNSDIMTDYFEKEFAYITKDSPFYNDALIALNKNR